MLVAAIFRSRLRSVVVALPASPCGAVSSRARARIGTLVEPKHVDVAALGISAPKAFLDPGALEADRVADTFAFGAFSAFLFQQQKITRPACAPFAITTTIGIAEEFAETAAL